ncbi:Hypothetical protein SRAE_X000087900 [Strongyloides ratti]|uniref:Uncharacterized protein n=1 Tax=Strongyloides ratti TaxID=34506 RepID=A0A090LNW3_STRRB|nr:Hypothetical protein SRAE_X000087900 [Strongyloides ratti]CEF71555.1 Hypothetical protein SRAE_X000087900 [Strongyloides ratti]
MFYRFYRQQQREQLAALTNNSNSINFNTVFGNSINSNIILPFDSSNIGCSSNYSKHFVHNYKRISNPEIFGETIRGRRKFSRNHSSFRIQQKVPEIDDMIFTQSIRGEDYSPAVALFKTAGFIRSTAGIDSSKVSFQHTQPGIY